MKENVIKPREILHVEAAKNGSRLVFASEPFEARKRAENRERTSKDLNSAGYKWLGKGGGRHYNG